MLDLINRINISFGRYYASMQCAGEVCLYTGEGEDQVVVYVPFHRIYSDGIHIFRAISKITA